MREDLLQYSLERISSLQHFYKSELKTINRKANKGMVPNRFGYLMDYYFRTLISGTEAEQQGASFQQLKKQAEQYVKVINLKDEKNQKEISYRIEKIEELKAKGFNLDIPAAAAAFKQYADMPIIHGDNTLTMLITRFEEFISNFLARIYLTFPDKYINAQKITFGELNKLTALDIDSIQKKIVVREIDSIMRESYEKWFGIFESHHMDISACKDEILELKEIYARRNILVHNSGRVNETYINCVPKTKYALGTQLDATEDYLDRAFEVIKIVIFILNIAAVIFEKENKEDYLYNVFGQAFIELSQKQYSISKVVFLSLANNKDANQEIRNMSQVNCWIAKRELEGKESICKEVEGFDVSALDPTFKIAKETLLENYDRVNSMLEAFCKNENKGFFSAIKEWPLFMHYRETEQYKAFAALHKEEFNISSLEVGQDSTDSKPESVRKELAEAKLNENNVPKKAETTS